jgi:hypothetical protein
MKVCCAALATAALLVLSAIPVDAQTNLPDPALSGLRRHCVHSNSGSVRNGCALLSAQTVRAVSEAAVVSLLAGRISLPAERRAGETPQVDGCMGHLLRAGRFKQYCTTSKSKSFE